MLNGYNTNTRRFTTDNPILYNGQYYPSTTMPVDDGTGNIQDMTVFADRSGNYFNQSGTPVMLQDTLPEVVVHPTQPTQEEMAANMFNSYLTMSNDRTKVSNVPHRQYNTHLNDRTIQGAKSNALWEKEHPNLDAWGKTLSAVPFAVAAGPAAMAGGKAMLGTTAGQYIKNKAIQAMANPLVEMANTSLGLGFGAKGAYDVSQGDVTPSTLLELAGIYPGIKAAKELTGISKVSQNKSITHNLQNFGDFEDNTFKFSGYIEDPLQMHIKRAKAKGYDTSNIKILDLSQDTPEIKSFIERTANQFDMTIDDVKSYLLKHMNTHGHAAVPNWEKVIIHDGKGGNKLNAILSHELDHLLHTPDKLLPDGIFFPRIKNLYGDEFIKGNNTEVAARGSQLHDYFGHTGNEPITEEMLKYAKDNYVKDTGINNDMNDILWSINDYKGLADWMTKYSTGVVPLGIISTTYNSKE